MRERHTRGFVSKYHMTETAFNKLVDLLRPRVTLNAQKSMNSTSGNYPIIPEIVVGIGLRFLGGGGKLKSLEDVFGIDVESVRRLRNLFFDAVENTETLAIKLPTIPDEYRELSRGFQNLSDSEGIINGVIGAIDG